MQAQAENATAGFIAGQTTPTIIVPQHMHGIPYTTNTKSYQRAFNSFCSCSIFSFHNHGCYKLPQATLMNVTVPMLQNSPCQAKHKPMRMTQTPVQYTALHNIGVKMCMHAGSRSNHTHDANTTPWRRDNKLRGCARLDACCKAGTILDTQVNLVVSRPPTKCRQVSMSVHKAWNTCTFQRRCSAILTLKPFVCFLGRALGPMVEQRTKVYPHTPLLEKPVVWGHKREYMF